MLVEPIANHRAERDEACRLCGSTQEPLTRTHVPMRRSGNDGPMRPLVRRREQPEALPILDYGRSSDGGIWGWWFCGPCNRRTGRWDEAYQTIWHRILDSVHKPEHASSNQYRATASFDVGSFVRSLIAWAFALDETLREREPAVAAAVLSGDAGPGPQDHFIGLALTRSTRIFVSAQPEAREVSLDLSTGESRSSGNPRVVVAAPPFNLVLAERESADRVPHLDLGGLLSHPAEHSTLVTLSLPIIDVNVPDGPSGPIGFDALDRAVI